jgi:hypothetical protein
LVLATHQCLAIKELEIHLQLKVLVFLKLINAQFEIVTLADQYCPSTDMLSPNSLSHFVLVEFSSFISTKKCDLRPPFLNAEQSVGVIFP